MLSASASSGFSHKVHNVRFEKQVLIPSYLTVIELGQIAIENWLSIGFELEIPWLWTYSHNHYTMSNLQYDEES